MTGNITNYHSVIEKESFLSFPYAASAVSFAAASLMEVPTVSNKIEILSKQLWEGILIAKNRFENSGKKLAEMTASVGEQSGKFLIQGSVCFNECVDIHNAGGTKDPLKSIHKSREKLKAHNLSFANCIEFLADQAADAYHAHSEMIKSKVCKLVSGDLEEVEAFFNPIAEMKFSFFSQFSNFIDDFMSSSQQLIGQTIKANIMHIAANLADEGYDEAFVFQDRHCNPFGRLLSVIGNCLNEYKGQLEAVVLLPQKERDLGYDLVFIDLSSRLLAKIFPKGHRDLQLFHPTIPFVNVIKGGIWQKMNENLPILLKRLYLETRPVADGCQNWKGQFDAEVYGLKVDQLVQLPTSLIRRAVRSDRARALDSLKPILKKYLQKKNFFSEDIDQLSDHLVKYAKELLLTKEPALHMMGVFFERYFMERILFNLSKFAEEEDLPVPLFILKKWVEEGLLNVLSQSLGGEILTADQKIRAVNQFLAPFGLNQEESFPLPSFIKEAAWPMIAAYLKGRFPDQLLKGLPTWKALKAKISNQTILETALGDRSLTKTISNFSGGLTEILFDLMQSIPSISEQINRALSSPVLCLDQQNAIDEQWRFFLNEKDSARVLKNFGNQCIHAVFLEVCAHLYKNYQKQMGDLHASEALSLVGFLYKNDGENRGPEDREVEEALNVNPLSFSAWLVIEIAKAGRALSIDGEEIPMLDKLQRAVMLKNSLRIQQDLAQKEVIEGELNDLWKEVRPKFDYLALQLLKILNYTKVSDLPFPAELQPALWGLLNDKLPYLLFEQLGDFMLPLLEKEQLLVEIETFQNGEMIKQGSRLLAQDIVEQLPNWFENKLDFLLDAMVTEGSGYVVISRQAGIALTESFIEVIHLDHPAYKPILILFESYIEGILLKIASKIGKMDQETFQDFFSLVHEVKNQLARLDDLQESEEGDRVLLSDHTIPAQEILAGFTDNFFSLLGLEAPKDLFGIPQSLQELVLKKIKVKMADGLLKFYFLEHKFRHYVIKPNPIDVCLPTARVVRATHALIRYVLDAATNKLTHRAEEGLEVIPKIYRPLNQWLSQETEKNYRIFKHFQDLIANEIPTPFLASLFDLLDHQSAQSSKEILTNWINPLVADFLIERLVLLLDRKPEEKAAFEQEILAALLPIFTLYLKQLNGEDLEEGEGAAGLFYRNQSELIFQLILPQGKDDLGALLPNIDMSDDQFNEVLETAHDLVAQQLPQALEVLFDKETTLSILTSLFENLIDVLDNPIGRGSPQFNFLTEEEKEQQKKIDEQIGLLVMEGAKILDLPVGIFKNLPGWAQRIKKIDDIEKNAYTSVGALIRENFNGELLAKIFTNAMSKLEEKKYVKLTREERIANQQEAELKLDQLERKLAERSLTYFFRYIGARFEKETDLFSHPVMKFLHKVFLSMSSFILVTLIGSVLRFLKIEQFVLNQITKMIHHRSQKLQFLFSAPPLHEKMIFDGVEALENILMGRGVE